MALNFSETVKSFLTDKIVSKNKIHLIKTDLETADILNIFLSITQNLDIIRYSDNEPFSR